MLVCNSFVMYVPHFIKLPISDVSGLSQLLFLGFSDQCNGLTVHSCLNGGTLVNDASGCHCQCTSDYGGDTCQTRSKYHMQRLDNFTLYKSS